MHYHAWRSSNFLRFLTVLRDLRWDISELCPVQPVSKPSCCWLLHSLCPPQEFCSTGGMHLLVSSRQLSPSRQPVVCSHQSQTLGPSARSGLLRTAVAWLWPELLMLLSPLLHMSYNYHGKGVSHVQAGTGCPMTRACHLVSFSPSWALQ